MLSSTQFREIVYTHYTLHPRKIEMPWRTDTNPYFVLLSEFMLQQTQVSRVLEYFNIFTTLWPSIEDLAQANFQDVLFHWQGLGYNRRAKYLHACAKQICDEYGGIIPQDIARLKSLPGIGEYTASAILAFAFNEPVVVLETNIRRAIIHHFFVDENNISENRIKEKVEEVLDHQSPRLWYWAFMDYGSYISSITENPNRRSKSYQKQSGFEGSNRQLRGQILKLLLSYDKGLNIETVYAKLPTKISENHTIEDLNKNLSNLVDEGILVCEDEQKYIVSKD